MTDNFAHGLRIDSIRDGDHLDLVADDQERAAIAGRLGLLRLDRLEAHADLSRTGDLVRAKGRLLASLEQSCVITGEPVAAHIDEPFALAFTPEPGPGSADEEIELGASDCDTVFHDGAAVDLGGAIADSLALALDPYPRSAGAQAALREAGVMTEMDASPFAVLAKLKSGDEA